MQGGVIVAVGLFAVAVGAADAPAPTPATATASGGAAAGAVAGAMVKNGEFEVVDPADKEKPQFWERLDGLGVQWTNAPADDKGRAAGKAIRMNTAISEKDIDAHRK